MLINLNSRCKSIFTMHFSYISDHISVYGNCSGTFNDDNNTIWSPNYPHEYPNHANCFWFITGPPGSQIKLNFTDFHLESQERCLYDSLTIFNGSNEDIFEAVGSNWNILGGLEIDQKLCGNIIPDQIVSSGNVSLLQFTSDRSDTRKGFKIIVSIKGNIL